MSIYNPPTQDQTIFNPTNFGTTAETTIDEAYLDQNYLSFPVAQGTQTLVDTIIQGNITQTGNINLTGNLVVGSTNVITELTSLDTRLDAEEPKTTALQTLTEGHTDDIASLDTRLDAEEIKITALQTLTEGHTDDIASNTADILTKQPTITTATDLDCKTLTTTQLEVNGGVNIDTHTYFDTIVIRRPTGFSGDANFFLGIRELQCWVNDVNILFNNGLTSNYALWSNPETSLGGLTEEVYNNITSVVSYEVVDTANSSDIALIITNIPLTAINTIQSLVLYSRTAGKQYSEGLAIELYKYTDLTEILATTNIISLKREIYRFDFPSIDTYTGGFATDDSITQIISEGDIVIEDALFTPLNVDITGDVVVVGDLTAENLIVGSTNVITEINTKQDIITDGSLTIARTDGLQTALTALQSNIDTNDGSTTSSITSLETQVSSLINFSSGGINFRAYYNLTTVITSPQIVPYSIEEYDSNNNYDITTYIFTIPIAGTYIFTFGWYVVEGSTAVVNLIRRRGGVETILQQSTNGTMTNGIVSFVLSTLVECLATDEIFVYIVSGSILLTYGSDSSLGFSGARISN